MRKLKPSFATDEYKRRHLFIALSPLNLRALLTPLNRVGINHQLVKFMRQNTLNDDAAESVNCDRVLPVRILIETRSHIHLKQK
jgi:hypothetical protein